METTFTFIHRIISSKYFYISIGEIHFFLCLFKILFLIISIHFDYQLSIYLSVYFPDFVAVKIVTNVETN